MKNKVINKIIKELSYYNISIDYDELNEVCKIFEHLISYGFEVAMKDTDANKVIEVPTTKEYYSFATKMIPEPFEQNYLDLLINIIVLKRNNLLHYLDYGLITYAIARSFNYNHPVHILADYTQRLVSNINNPKKIFFVKKNRFIDFTFDYWYSDNWLVELFEDYIYTIINRSEMLSQDYKDIINCYKNMYEFYNDFSFDNDLNRDDDCKFGEFITYSYYYFLFNDKLNTEKDKIISFINGITTNPEFVLDSLKMNGIKTAESILEYIEYLYNENNNSLSIR